MRRTVKRLAITVIAALCLLAVYGVAVEPRFILDDRRYDIELPHLPAGADGTSIAVFADLQIGMWLDNPGMVQRIVERVVEERPGAALIAGDFLYSSDPGLDEQVRAVVELLAPLPQAGIPTYAVLGNHDYAVGAADLLTTELPARGIQVLTNAAAPIPGTGDAGSQAQALYVVGLGAHRPGRTDVDQALTEVPADAPRVVFMHNPASFPVLPAASAPLAMAGHTHCGQVAIPGFPAWSWLELRSNERVVTDGFAPDGYGADGNRLYVTCGIGFSVVPARIAAPPQVVFFDLHAP